MDLREILSRNKSAEFLWSLVVEPDWVQAGIWTIVSGEAKVVSVSNPVAWEKKEDLVSAADTALSSAAQTLPEDAHEPNKVVFGVPASWVKDGSISQDHLDWLKELCAKLTLTPSGFVTLPEAVSFYIKSQEGAPLTAVTLSLGKELVEVSVFRLGNLLGTTQVARSLSLFDDVVEGLSRFSLQDPVPSRFILFDGKEGELEEARQSLISASWDGLTKIKIMHTPKIETLSADRKVEAVSLGGATEIAQVTKVKLLTGESKEIEGSAKSTEGDAVQDVQAAEEMGFVVDQDVSKIEGVDNLVSGEDGLPEKPVKKKRELPKIFGVVSGKLSKFFSSSKKPFIFGFTAIVLVVVGLFAFWWFYPKATVTIYVSPQTLSERADVFVSSEIEDINVEEKMLPGRVVSDVEEGEKTTSTTGTKLVGEKSAGEVEVRNVSGEELEIDSGTVLVASNGLEFVTEDSITIPANTSTVDPGKEKVKVSAGDIGSEYNLPKDELFKVGTYSKAEVDAVATTDFSGGASRQIDAIGEDDRDRVLDELTAELTEKAKGSLSASVGEDEFFIDGSARAEVESQEYSGKVGDEADSLKLTLTVKVTGIVVSKGDLFKFAQNSLSEKVPRGYLLRETQVEYQFDLKQYDEELDMYELAGEMSANLLPEVDTEDIKLNIVGKYPEVAQDYLSKIPGFVRAQISISPRFPGKLGTLPRVLGNLTVDLASDQ